MDAVGPTNTKIQLWEQLEKKVGYISFFGHFQDNVLAGFPRTKIPLEPFKAVVSHDGEKTVTKGEAGSKGKVTAKKNVKDEESEDDEDDDSEEDDENEVKFLDDEFIFGNELPLVEVKTVAEKKAALGTTMNSAFEKLAALKKIAALKGAAIPQPIAYKPAAEKKYEGEATTLETAFVKKAVPFETSVTEEKLAAQENVIEGIASIVAENSKKVSERTVPGEVSHSKETAQTDGPEKDVMAMVPSQNDAGAIPEKSADGKTFSLEKSTTGGAAHEDTGFEMEVQDASHGTSVSQTTASMGISAGDDRADMESVYDLIDSLLSEENDPIEEKPAPPDPDRLWFDDISHIVDNLAPRTASYQGIDAASARSGSQKRCRSPSSYSVCDAPSSVEHEGPEMSGKSPGAKRRRLDNKHTSFSDGLSTRATNTTAKHALELTDSADPYARKAVVSAVTDMANIIGFLLENEGEVVSAKRIRTSMGEEGEVELYEPSDSQPQTFREKASSHNTRNAPKQGSTWSAHKRYHSSTNNSLPDYGPLRPSVENSKHQENEEPMRGRPVGQGSFRPVNRLSSKKPKSPYPNYPAARYSPPRPFDFHGDQYKRSDHKPQKKQKLETGWNDKSPPGDMTDDDSYATRGRGRPGRDRGQNGSSQNSRRVISPQPLDRRNMLQARFSDGVIAKSHESDRFVKPQGRYSKPEASKASTVRPENRRPLRGDDPKDPITDTTDAAAGEASKYTPQVVIKGLKGSSYDSPPHPDPPSIARPAAQLIDSEDSMDDLSAGHYKKPLPTLSDKRKRSEPQPARTKKENVEPQTIHDTSDEETGKLEDGNIKPTNFPPSKKAPPKEKKPGQERYQIFQVFSPTHPWFLGDANRELFVVYNRVDGDLSIEGQGIPRLVMTVNSISSVEYSEESSKIIIHKSRDNSFGRSINISLTLSNANDSVKLAKLLALSTTTKALPKSRDHLEKVFVQARKSAVANSKKHAPAKEERTSASHSVQNPRPRIGAREPSTRGPRVIDFLHNNDEESSKAPSRSTKTVPDGIKSDYTPTYFDLTGDEHSSEPLAAKSEDKPQSTRSSARLKDEAPPSDQAISGEFEWTKANPGWKEHWKSSILYPPKGRDKATIDAEDIERLDDGNYLNDNLIEFYTRWLQVHVLADKPEVAKRIYIMNTFFYERLTTSKSGKKGFNYEAVERWTAKVDLLSYDYIVVPVNENTHWYLAIICNVLRFLGPDPDAQEASQSQEDGTRKNEKAMVPASPEPVMAPAESSQSQPQSTTPTKKGKRKSHGPPPRKFKTDEPRIITLDSLGARHSPTCTHLKEYLIAEIKSKHGIKIPSPGAIGMTATNIPLQDNFSDCGLFLLNYLEKFLEQPNKFIHSIMQNTVGFIQEWPNASETRAKIRDILFDLQAEQIAESEKPKKSKEEDSISSEKGKSGSPATSESRSPDEDASISSSSEQAVKPPIREQSATTLSDASSFEGFSRLSSLGAGEVDNSEEETPPIHKPTRERRSTPFPTGRGEDNSGEEGGSKTSRSTVQHGAGLESEDDYFPDPNNNYYDQGTAPQFDEGGNEDTMLDQRDDGALEVCETDVDEATEDTAQDESQDAGIEDNEMLLYGEDDRLTNRSAARSPSPRLLSDPSFISSSSSSSTTPEQQPSKVLASPPSTKKPKSPSVGPIPLPGASYADAADSAIVGHSRKRLPKH